MEGKKFSTLLGNQIEWHTDPQVMPSLAIRDSIIIAYAYRRGGEFDNIADRIFLSANECYLRNDNSTYIVAWAYIDKSAPDDVLKKIIEERKQYERDHADEIRAKRIAELEAELSRLKGE